MIKMNMIQKKPKSTEAYRLLFPFGVVFGLIGVSVWLAHAFLPRFGYPAQIHSELMMGAFLFAFAAGFLMTAIPKMTASFPAETPELIAACVLTLTTALSASMDRPEFFYLTSALSILGLVAFFMRRFLARTKPVPLFFPFVFFGLLSGLVGASILGLSNILEIQPVLHAFGRRVYFEGMILFLTLGIGSRLIPVISGREPLDESGLRPVIKNICLSGLLLAGFILEAFGRGTEGGIIKILVVSWIACFGWGIFAKSKTKSSLAMGMRFSGLMVWGGLAMTVIQPDFAVHWMHLTYIAGFGLMTLTVASRVTLAHGSYDLIYESQSNALWIIGALIMIAAVARVAAPFTGSGYMMHLVYAAVLWILAIMIWGTLFLRRIFWKGTAKVSC